MYNNKRNRPKPVKPHTSTLNQCEAPVDTSCWAKHYIERRTKKLKSTGWKLDQCGKGATVHLCEHDFCAQHAGILALAIVLGEVSEEEGVRNGPKIVSWLSAGN